MKRYYRSKLHRMLGGVCGGLADYTNVDPVIWRLLFLIAPMGFPAYIIIWLISESNIEHD